MRIRSWVTLLCLVCLFITSSGCVEYRLTRGGHPDRYYGWAKTKKDLDPKLGPKGKLYLINGGNVMPYIGGNFRRNNARAGVGVVYYPVDNVSIELGYRRSLFDVKHLDDKRIRRVNPLRDTEEIFYIGGVIKW